VLAWEAIFPALGALEAKVSKSLNPQPFPTAFVISMVVTVIVGIGVGCSGFR
jgi:hypothetical protein